jgi:hypothetical protein
MYSRTEDPVLFAKAIYLGKDRHSIMMAGLTIAGRRKRSRAENDFTITQVYIEAINNVSSSIVAYYCRCRCWNRLH